jgi:hypothetical protein
MSKFVCLLNKHSEGVFNVYFVVFSFVFESTSPHTKDWFIRFKDLSALHMQTFFAHLNQKLFVNFAGQGLFLGDSHDFWAYTLGIWSFHETITLKLG